MICSNCGHENKSRTTRQNSAIHLYFNLLSNELINQGVDLRTLVREDVDILPTPTALKELWRQLQIAMLKKESTTQLSTKDIDVVYDVFNKLIGERTGIHIPFPNIDELINRD